MLSSGFLFRRSSCLRAVIVRKGRGIAMTLCTSEFVFSLRRLLCTILCSWMQTSFASLFYQAAHGCIFEQSGPVSLDLMARAAPLCACCAFLTSHKPLARARMSATTLADVPERNAACRLPLGEILRIPTVAQLL